MSDTALRPPPTPGSRRRARRSALRLCGRILGALSMAVALVGGALAYLAISGTPVPAPDWVARSVETRLNAALDARGRVSVDRIEVTAEHLIPRARMRNVGLYDARGVEVARLNEVGARLAAPALLGGRLELNGLRISGAQITVRRLSDGTFDLSFGAASGTTGTLAGVLDAIDQAFGRAPLSRLESIRADELTITLEDALSGRLWQVTDGRIELLHGGAALKLTVTADVFNGTEDLASTVIELETLKGSPEASIRAVFENAAAADIAAQSPALAFLDVLDAPISGTLSADIGADGAVTGFVGTLEVGQGVLQPTPGTEPIAIESAAAQVSYDAAARRLGFDALSLDTGAARGRAVGQAFLEDFAGPWPGTLVAQFQLTDVTLTPEGMFADPVDFDRGAVDFRLRLDPFSVEIGQLALMQGDQRALTDGTIRGTAEGWDAALNLKMTQVPLERLMALWPVRVAPKARAWVGRNVRAGTVSELAGAFRSTAAAERPVLSFNFAFSEAEVKALRHLPPVTAARGYASLVGGAFTTVVEAGRIVPPGAPPIEVAGSHFRVRDVTEKPGRAAIRVRSSSTIASVLALLDLPPLELMKKAGRGTDFLAGQADLTSDFAFAMGPEVPFEAVEYTVSGRLRDVASDTLVPERTLRAEALDIRATPAGVAVSGAGRLDALPVNMVWSQDFGPEAAGGSRVEGTVALNQAFLDAFDIALPPGSLEGEGVASVTVELARDTPPEFRLVSDLNRLTMRLPDLGWSKAANRTGRLEVVGRLGTAPAIDRIALEAPGLSLSGVIDLDETGAMTRADFDRVRVGGWLDGPVTLLGRGAGVPPAVQILSGEIDLREANFGAGSGGRRGGGGPITLRLQRLIVTEGIAFTNFEGLFDSRGGLQGKFNARVNGRTWVTGNVIATATGSAVRLTSQDAGGALAASDILTNARGGTLDLTLVPTGRAGLYDGSLAIRDTRIVEAPAMTELLSAISIVGLIDQMNSGGITMSEVDARFQLSPSRLTLLRFSGVGPSLGISLDGIYDLQRDRIDMQGVVSPVYFLNGIGEAFTRRGEGLFGFNFNLRGRAARPSVSVNPLSLLTPGMFREIFRRPPPVAGR